MEHWRDVLQLKDNEYLKLNVSLYKCGDSYPETDFSEQEQSHIPTSTSKPPLLKNVLGENVFKSLKEWFVDSEIETVDAFKDAVNHVDPCELIYNGETTFSPTVLFLRIIALLLTLGVVFVTMYYIRNRFRKLQDLRKGVDLQTTTDGVSLNQNKESGDKMDQSNVESLTELSCSDPIVIVPDLSQNRKTEKCQIGTCLVYQGEVGTTVLSEKGIEALPFLEKTSDKLFKKLDKLLLKGLAEGQSAAQNCQATPRLARRSLQRRQRTGSSPMLASMVDSVENGRDDTVNEEQDSAWIDFKLFSEHLNWNYPSVCRVNPTNFPPNVQKLLHFYRRVCPIPQNAWKTATLIVNYVLYLISLELTYLRTKSGYRFVEFLGNGSVKNGTRVSKCNQFDVLMLLQPPVPPDVVVGNSVDALPPGMVVIGSQTTKERISKNVLSRIDLNGTQLHCLSSKECLIAAEDLMEECLHSLYTNTRSALDRLPFQVKGAPTGSCVININTRALVGFGESEIRIRLQPVLRLPMHGWYQKPILYATPPVLESEVRQRESTSLGGGVNHDFMWSLDTCDLEGVFNEEASVMMRHARINSCHLVCLMILKGLLTGCRKTSLVDRGVFPARHISTVMNYLVLESSPNQWNFDRLADRFSDAIRFLQSAYESSRLPEFLVSNPHLIGKMPSVANNEVLVQKRQKNMLIETTREALDKRLDYLKSCLRESGLKDCVKDEFSSDMWEFEFFLFS